MSNTNTNTEISAKEGISTEGSAQEGYKKPNWGGFPRSGI